MSYCQCRLKLVFSSIFRQFGWTHVALLIDRSDLFSITVGKHKTGNLFIFDIVSKIYMKILLHAVGKNLEYGLKQEGIDTFVRELNGNDEETYDKYLIDASMKARVVILSVRGALVRKFMLSAYSLGMTRGEYVFLDVEIFQV